MKKYFVDYEINNPEPTTGTVRVLAADKIRMEAHARAEGWQLEDGPRMASLTIFYALTRTGIIGPMEFTEFVDNILVDFAPGEDPSENPTKK